MKLLILLTICLLILWIMMAAQCSRFTIVPSNGLVWNRANATSGDGISWTYKNTSIHPPIWNPANPCYVPCNTFTGANYAPEGTVLSYTPDTEPDNRVPFCWNCHGGYSIARFGNTSTGIVHSGGNPLTYGE